MATRPDSFAPQGGMLRCLVRFAAWAVGGQGAPFYGARVGAERRVQAQGRLSIRGVGNSARMTEVAA